MPAKSGSSTHVRAPSRVVAALEELPPDVAASVARAIEQIGREDGEPFRPPDGQVGERYMAMVPDHDEAPVVVYREDNSGYLITGLTKRADYRTYKHSEPPQTFLDTPAGQAALIAGGALLIFWLISRAKGGSAGSTGTGS